MIKTCISHARGSFRQQQQQQPRTSPGPVRKPIPIPGSNGRVAGLSNPQPPPVPAAAVQQPMGLPRTGKLVPGRMSSGRENQSRDKSWQNFGTYQEYSIVYITSQACNHPQSTIVETSEWESFAWLDHRPGSSQGRPQREISSTAVWWRLDFQMSKQKWIKLIQTDLNRVDLSDLKNLWHLYNLRLDWTVSVHWPKTDIVLNIFHLVVFYCNVVNYL